MRLTLSVSILSGLILAGAVVAWTAPDARDTAVTTTVGLRVAQQPDGTVDVSVLAPRKLYEADLRVVAGARRRVRSFGPRWLVDPFIIEHAQNTQVHRIALTRLCSDERALSIGTTALHRSDPRIDVVRESGTAVSNRVYWPGVGGTLGRLLVLAGPIGIAVIVWRDGRRRRRLRTGRCLACGYTFGGSGTVCPECGRARVTP